jgi:hypothetical protein
MPHTFKTDLFVQLKTYLDLKKSIVKNSFLEKENELVVDRSTVVANCLCIFHPKLHTKLRVYNVNFQINSLTLHIIRRQKFNPSLS